MGNNNGWRDYKKLVLHEMGENTKRLDRVIESLGNLQSDVAGLKMKASIAGGVAGLVATGIVTALLQMWK